MKTALVTGGLGFIGSHITAKLAEENSIDKVIVLDHYGGYIDPTREDFRDFRKHRLDKIKGNVVIERGQAKHFSVLQKIMWKYRPNYIFHLAALPLAKINNLNSEEAMEGSVQSTSSFLEIIDSIDDYKPDRFIYTSSSMVYGDFVTEIATEDMETNPKEIYGTMKLAGEIITKGLCNFYDIPYTIIRPSAVYGPTDMNRRVSQIFLNKAFNNEKITINGIDEKLDFTYVKDLAKGFILAAFSDNAINETFNLTYGKAHTLLQYVECLKKHFPELEYEVTERDAFRPKRGTLSIEKAKKLINFSPVYDLQRGVDEYVAFLKDNWIQK